MSRYYDDYLCHHGILGQKWGKKNGPPYPLDASDYSASEFDDDTLWFEPTIKEHVFKTSK